MPRRPSRKFPNIAEARDPRSGEHRGWRAQVWVDKTLKRGKTRETQEDAYEDAKGLLTLRTRLDDDDPDPTLKVAMERVRATLEVKGRRPGTASWYEEQFKVLLKEWPEETRLREIDRKKVQAWIMARAKTVSANSIHHYLRALRRLFRVVNLPSPTSDSRLLVPDTVPAKVEIMSWPDVKKVLAKVEKADPHGWGILGLIAYTGVRRSEIARLRIEDVDLDDEVLHVRQAKVARLPRSLPMPEGLVELAAHAMQRHGMFGGKFDEEPWLLPGKTENQRVEFLVRLARKWKVKLHVLRHSFASELARRGVPPHTIARLLGHSIGGMTMRYVHEAAPELRAAMERLWK